MSDLNKDGNLFGRLTAALTLAAVIIGVARICGISVCPMANCGACPFTSGQK